MTGKELVLSVLHHQQGPRLPWVPFVGVHAGKIIGKDATAMLTDGDNLYHGVLEAAKLYQADGVPIMFDLQVEAEILGCELVWAPKGPPSVKTHPLEDSDEVPCVCKVPSASDGRLPLILDTMKRVKAAIGDTTALYGLICGPFTLASHLRGTNIFMDMYDNEEYIKQLMAFTGAVATAMAQLYIEAGMDVIAVVDPLVSQISPDAFAQFLTEPFTKLFDFIREKGALSSFFVCGNATRNIEEMCKTGPDGISVDENVKMVSAKEITDRYNITLGGNIPLTTVMLHGSQLENMKCVVDLIDSLTPQNLIISPGCDMPYDTPVENTIAASQAVHDTAKIRAMVADYQTPADEYAKIDIQLPDYAALTKPLIEVCTLDSETCAACTYMMAAANDIKAAFGDAVDVVEYKYMYKQDIARFMKMGVAQLPSIYINGKLAYSSLIPSKADFTEKVNEAIAELKK
ncbi:MAG: thioredoxin family protein [Oscillospiraceae bacterium]|nr:thioredoxin family protein [Oscillospiraceae bacterium]